MSGKPEVSRRVLAENIANMSEETRRLAIQKRAAKMREHWADPLAREAHSKAFADSQRGKPKRALAIGKSEHNIRAKRWYLLSPDNTLYECVNLNHFVREHTQMFVLADVEWKRKRPGSLTEWCRAANGLYLISQSGGSWKDWRVAKDPEILHVIQAQRRFPIKI